MDIKDIVTIVVALGVIGGVIFKFRSNKKKKDSNNKNTKNTINQNNISGGNSYQAGRDNNVK